MLFPGGKGGNFDAKNWPASFTKSVHVVRKNEFGRSNHKGRDRRPVVLVVGNKSVPTMLGHSGDGRR